MFSASQRSTIKIVVSTLLSTIVVSTLVYAATISGVMTQTIIPNDTIGAGWFQQMNDRMEQVCPGGVCPGSGSSPSGAITAFNLASCPIGWSAADGGGGRPDLRGEFIRGLDGGRGVDTGRVLATAQADELESHTHALGGYWAGIRNIGGPAPWSIPNDSFQQSTNAVPFIQPTGGAETRPRNVAFLYCIKN
jgi:hypothetical protein